MTTNLVDWRARMKLRISRKVPLGVGHEQEVERRLTSALDFEVPSDAELIAMQARGELASDEELARDLRLG